LIIVVWLCAARKRGSPTPVIALMIIRKRKTSSVRQRTDFVGSPGTGSPLFFLRPPILFASCVRSISSLNLASFTPMPRLTAVSSGS